MATRHREWRMRIYWSVNSAPELAALPRDERQSTFHRAVQSHRTQFTLARRIGEGVVLCLVGGIAGVVFFLLTSSAAWGGGLGGIVGAAVGNHIRLAQARTELRSAERPGT